MTRLNAIGVPMLDHLHRRRYTPPRSERGQALILLLVLLGMAASIFVFNTASNVSTYVSPTAERIDNDALAQAKAALIQYVTITNLNTNRPGTFPCPDTDNDGIVNLYSGTNCPGYVSGSNVYLGRLPWQTLGLPDLRDSSGERLWYAVSRDFARNPTCLPNCPDLTSDTLGQLTVNGRTVVAIVFAPGRAQGSQVRGTAGEQNTASNYLEGENGDSDATFTAAVAVASSTFNDRLLTIVNPDFIPEIEKYVANAMIALLAQYQAAVGVYPWADQYDGDSNASSGQYYNHWRFPCGTAQPTNWGSGGTPVLPAWLRNGCGNPVTGWTSVIYYAVAKNQLDNGGSNCTTCTGTSPPKLTVDGVAGTDVVLLTPGV